MFVLGVFIGLKNMLKHEIASRKTTWRLLKEMILDLGVRLLIFRGLELERKCTRGKGMESIWNRKDWHDFNYWVDTGWCHGCPLQDLHPICKSAWKSPDDCFTHMSFFPNPLQNKVRTEGAMKETTTRIIFQMQKKILEPYYDTQPPLTTPKN